MYKLCFGELHKVLKNEVSESMHKNLVIILEIFIVFFLFSNLYAQEPAG